MIPNAVYKTRDPVGGHTSFRVVAVASVAPARSEDDDAPVRVQRTLVLLQPLHPHNPPPLYVDLQRLERAGAEFLYREPTPPSPAARLADVQFVLRQLDEAIDHAADAVVAVGEEAERGDAEDTRPMVVEELTPELEDASEEVRRLEDFSDAVYREVEAALMGRP